MEDKSVWVGNNNWHKLNIKVYNDDIGNHIMHKIYTKLIFIK